MGGERKGRGQAVSREINGLGERAKEGDWAVCVQLCPEVRLSKTGKKLRSWELGRR